MIEIPKGMWFRDAVILVQSQLGNKQYETFKFNDIVITVSKDSNIDDLGVIYYLKCELRKLKGE